MTSYLLQSPSVFWPASDPLYHIWSIPTLVRVALTLHLIYLSFSDLSCASYCICLNPWSITYYA
jgi:hypothetical protein